MTTATPLPRLVLIQRQYRLSRGQRVSAAIAVVVVFAVCLWLVGMTYAIRFGDLGLAALQKLIGKLGQRFHEAPGDSLLDAAELLLVIIAVVFHLWYFRRASRYERLTLDSSGIRYQSPLPERFRSLYPDWSLSWSQVREARILVPKGLYHPNLVVLELDAYPKRRKLFPLRWTPADAAPPGEGGGRERFFAGLATKPDVQRTLQQAQESPIVAYAREAGVKTTTEVGRGAASGFALEKNPHALAGVALVLGLGLYGVFDLALNEEIYAVEPPHVLFALAGAVVMLIGLLWLASAKVPRAETFGLALLLGGAAGLALYPGALRLNAATDVNGLRAYDYRLKEYVVFSPVDADVPEMRLPKDADYWGQFKLGTVHPFDLRKGGLGFYQVDMGPVHARMHAYFAKQN